MPPFFNKPPSNANKKNRGRNWRDEKDPTEIQFRCMEPDFLRQRRKTQRNIPATLYYFRENQAGQSVLEEMKIPPNRDFSGLHLLT